MPSFDALLELPFATLSPEQLAAAATLGLDEAGWAAAAARARAADDAQTALRQHVPLFRYNALEDELHRLQQQLLEQDLGGGARGSGGGGGGGRVSPSGSPLFMGGRRSSPTQSIEAICPMCALAYIAEIRSTEVTKEGHYRYEIVLTQRGNEVSVLHKRFSEFVVLRQSLSTQLRASGDLPADVDADDALPGAEAGAAPEPEAAAVSGSGAEAGLGEPLNRSSSSGESMKPFLGMIRTFPFPSKSPLRAAGGGGRLAETRRPVLAEWLNLVIKLARMEPCINYTVLRWLELDNVRDMSRLNQLTPGGGAAGGGGGGGGGQASPPPLVLS
jgi:hypothetical protein